MARRLLMTSGALVGALLWIAGAWQVYVANTLAGALLVLAGAMALITVAAARLRDPDAGADGFLAAIAKFFNRAT